MDNLGWGLIRIKDKAIFVATFVSFESRIDFLKSQGWSVFSRSGPSFKGYIYFFPYVLANGPNFKLSGITYDYIFGRENKVSHFSHPQIPMHPPCWIKFQTFKTQGPLAK